ncbi:hypothetical protein FXO37_09323 [Capsicum annuum]|nr:hypothetical protein FXO37_09323 [Capsicum annuum]
MGVMGDMSAMAKEGAKGAIGTIGTMGVLSTKRQTIGVKNKAPWAPSMGAQWLVDEVWGIFSPEADYNKGIQRSIGVLDMDKYFREENRFDAGEESTKKKLLESAVEEIKKAEDFWPKGSTRAVPCLGLGRTKGGALVETWEKWGGALLATGENLGLNIAESYWFGQPNVPLRYPKNSKTYPRCALACPITTQLENRKSERTTTNTGDPSGANTTNMSSTHVMHIRNGARTAGQNATANAPPVISTPTRGPKTSSTQPLCTHAANAEF